jgi:CBS-domain-containing membrane protein
MNATVKDVMSTHVVAVRENAAFKEIAAALREQRAGAFPVLDAASKVVGVVSETDLLAVEALDGSVHGLFQGLRHHRRLPGAGPVTAADLMTQPAVTIGADEPALSAARLLYSRRVKQLPVTSPDGTLIGIVSRSDVLTVYSRPDEAIEHEITQELILRALLGDPSRFTVTVKDGIVTIDGAPESADVGREIIDRARHVEGVVAVRDRLSYPPAERLSPGPLF